MANASDLHRLADLLRLRIPELSPAQQRELRVRGPLPARVAAAALVARRRGLRALVALLEGKSGPGAGHAQLPEYHPSPAGIDRVPAHYSIH